jgi:hypothetical protein
MFILFVLIPKGIMELYVKVREFVIRLPSEVRIMIVNVS